MKDSTASVSSLSAGGTRKRKTANAQSVGESTAQDSALEIDSKVTMNAALEPSCKKVKRESKEKKLKKDKKKKDKKRKGTRMSMIQTGKKIPSQAMKETKQNSRSWT